MAKPIIWRPGDPCPNCGGPMPKIPRPPEWRLKVARDAMHGTPVPQTFDTADDDTISEHGELYRCGPCDCKVRVKPPAPPADAPAGDTGE